MSRIEFGFRVAADHLSLPGHFPGSPIVPGVLLLDGVMHALQQATGLRLTHLRQVKFISALLPEEQAQAVCEIDGTRASFRVTAQRLGAAVAIAEGVGSLA
jgi:3-hydroxymyristoyl/3-hydroxydecanoyl-(acyl carrier protein) dehydratase